MRIGIFGSYNYTSIGDHAILEGILEQFRRRSDDLSAVIFSFDPLSTEDMLISHEGLRTTKASPYPPSRPTQDQSVSSCDTKSRGKVLKQRIKRVLAKWPKAASSILRLYRGWRLLKGDLALLKQVPFWLSKLREIRKLDILVIGGGNLLMDLYPSWPIYPLIYVAMARLARLPVMFYAVGAGPIRSWRARWYLRFASYLANAITLRDEESLDTVRKKLKINTHKLFLSADPATSLHYDWRKELRQTTSHPLIGMTVVPYYSPLYWPDPDIGTYVRYINFMAQVVESLVKRFGASVVFFMTNYPNDLRAAIDVVRKVACRDQVEIVRKRLSITEILSLIASCDIMVGTRLHSIILSTVAGTPSLAFSYQPKVTAFCRRIGFERYVIPLSDLPDISEDLLLSLLQEVMEMKVSIQARGQKRLEQLRQSADHSCEIAMTLTDGGQKQ